MKPLLLALIGMSLYATSGVLIEQKLSKFSVVALVLLYVVPMTVIAAIWLLAQKQLGQTIKFPTGSLLWLASFLGIMYFVADYFFLGAYTIGGNAIVISTIAILSPVLTAFVRHFFAGGWPNRYEVAGYALAAASVLLIAKGATSAGA